jgi:hypothetical protein
VAMSNDEIDKLLETVLDYVVEYHSGGEIVSAVSIAALGDDRAYVHFDEAFLVAHYGRKYPTADKMYLRSRLEGEMISFDLHYERRN